MAHRKRVQWAASDTLACFKNVSILDF